MKKILFLVLGFVLIGTGIYIISQGLQKDIEIVDILPDNAFFYGRIAGLEQKTDAFWESSFGQQLQSIDFSAVLRGLELDPQQMLYFESLQEKIFTEETQELFNKFFGQEIALAAYPPLKEEWTPQTLVQWPQYLCFVTRLRGRARLTEFLAQSFSKFEDKITHETVVYKKHKIHKLISKDNNVTVAFTRLGNLLIFGLTENAARQCIDVYKKERKSLSQYPQYIAVEGNFLADREAECFWDLGILGAKVKSMIIQMVSAREKFANLEVEKFRKNLNQLFGVKYISASMIFDPLVTLKGDLYYDKDVFSSRWASMLECAPQNNGTLDFISKDVKAYQWGNCYDFKAIWQELQAGAPAGKDDSPLKQSPKQLISLFEKDMGLEIEGDILPLLGNEVAYALWDINAKGIFPIPEMLVIFNVMDSQKAREVMNALVESQSVLRMEEDNYQGHVIRYINVPLISDLQPAYTILNKYILISPQRLVLRRAIDTMANPENSLREQPQFMDAQYGLNEESNSILFLQLPKLVGEIKVAADWMNQRFDKEQAKQEAFQKGQRKYLADIVSTLKQNQKELEDINGQLKEREPQRMELTVLSDQIRTVLQRIQGMRVTIPEEDLTYNVQWNELRTRLAQLNEQKSKMDFIDELEELGKTREILEKEVASDQEKAEEVQVKIAQFGQAESPVKRVQKSLLKNLMAPLLETFGEIEFFTGRTLFKDQRIESFFSWELK